MKKFLFGCTMFFAAVTCLGWASYGSVFTKTYAVSPDSELGKAKCGACHTGKMGGPLNAYGKDLKGQTKGSKAITAAMLKAVEGLDSDKDGKTNVAELKAGTNPGVK